MPLANLSICSRFLIAVVFLTDLILLYILEISTVALKIAQEKNGSDSHDKANQKIVPLSQIIMVPVDKYPTV